MFKDMNIDAAGIVMTQKSRVITEKVRENQKILTLLLSRLVAFFIGTSKPL